MNDFDFKFDIKKPDDSQDSWIVNCSIVVENANELENTLVRKVFPRIGKFALVENNPSRMPKISAHPDRHAKDPIHGGIVNAIKNMIQVSRKRRYSFVGTVSEYSGVLKIEGLPILLSKNNIRYSINGRAESLERIADILARLMFKATTTKDTNKLMASLYSFLDMPENVRYALENQTPYTFYQDFEKYEVRLKTQQIGDDEYALEVSDGIWGTMSSKDLVVFVNTYLHGKKRGSWYQISPKNLYLRTVGKEPSESDIKVMREFLKQNRTSEIVEKRARDLVKELESQYSDRITVRWDEKEMPQKIFVRGNDYDWLLVAKDYKKSFQNVSTYVFQPDEDEGIWIGPICIDNMNNDSSVGDQFAARVLAFINDNITVKLVSTLKHRIKTEPNTYRIDTNEVSRMWNE